MMKATVALVLVAGAAAESLNRVARQKGTNSMDEWDGEGTTLCGIDEYYMRNTDSCLPCEKKMWNFETYMDTDQHQNVACKLKDTGNTRQKLYITAWSETCETQKYSGSYNYMGTTADGRPYYQKGQGSYIYFDADCGGHQRGWPMWVLDSDHPNITSTTDLDGDDGCGVYAKSTYSIAAYPSSGQWSTRCADAGFTHMDVAVSIGGRATCGENEYYKVNGNKCIACGEDMFQDADNHRELACKVIEARTTELDLTDLRFTAIDDECSTRDISGRWMVKGHTADGRPYFQNMIDQAGGGGRVTTITEDYIYFDSSCGGIKTDRPMWVLDDEPPMLNATFDLDGDGACGVIAYSPYSVGDFPPSGLWRTHCPGVSKYFTDLAVTINEGWKQAECTTDEYYVLRTDSCHACKEGMYQDEEKHDLTQCKVSESITTDLTVNIESDACDMSPFNGMWSNAGETSDGRPYFMHTGNHGDGEHGDHIEGDVVDHYLYFDADCGEYGWDHPMWVVDESAPNTTVVVDLDLDDACVVSGKSAYAVTALPESGTWHIKCHGVFMKMNVAVWTPGSENAPAERPAMGSDNGEATGDEVVTEAPGTTWVKAAGLDKKGGKAAWISIVGLVGLWAIVFIAVKLRRSKYQELPTDLSENLTSESPTFGENEAFEN